MTPLVSVVIPTYKRPDMITRAVESVLNQTYKNVEIFVVDDNNPLSPERKATEKEMAQFASNPRVTYILHECNKKGSAARNTGWRHAKGQYITFLDDDDEIDYTKIEKQVNCLQNLDETWGCCYSAYKLLKESGDIQISSENRSGYRYIEALMRTLYMGSGSNLFLRKSVVDEVGGYDESFIRYQDIEFLVRVLEKYKIAFISEPLLIIHQQGYRNPISFEKKEEYDYHYLCKFKDRIYTLPAKEKKRVMTVISLERARMALQMKEFKGALQILLENKVDVLSLIKYISYIVHRKITHKSYGFDI